MGRMEMEVSIKYGDPFVKKPVVFSTSLWGEFDLRPVNPNFRRENLVFRLEGDMFENEAGVLYTLDTEPKEPISFEVDKVIFNDPATIVYWKDGTKTVVKTQNGESFDTEKGLAMAISKKAYGNKGNYNEVFKKNNAV